MTEAEFNEYIAKSDPEDKLVFIRLKYVSYMLGRELIDNDIL